VLFNLPQANVLFNLPEVQAILNWRTVTDTIPGFTGGECDVYIVRITLHCTSIRKRCHFNLIQMVLCGLLGHIGLLPVLKSEFASDSNTHTHRDMDPAGATNKYLPGMCLLAPQCF
jgi:hypothetical protein